MTSINLPYSKTGHRDDCQWSSVKMCEQYNRVIITLFPISVLWLKYCFFNNNLKQNLHHLIGFKMMYKFDEFD